MKAKTIRIKKIKLKNITSKKLYEFLMDNCACESARLWVDGKSLKQAFKTCQRADWMGWLTYTMIAGTGDLSWGDGYRWDEITRRAQEAWDKSFYISVEGDYDRARKAASDVWRKYYEVI